MRFFLTAAAIGLAILFFWGLEQIAVAPLETGEVYPPYSSLRFDPLGARALFESLSQMPGVTVERLYKPRATLSGSGATILVLGVDVAPWTEADDKTLEEYEKLLPHGGRLVIAFLPVRTPAKTFESGQSLSSRWNIRLAYRNIPGTASNGKVIPRDSALYFVAGPEWKNLRQRDSAIVERDLGGGTVVLVSDSFFLSNEGLRQARDAELIARVIGPSRRIVFDENHFGIVETGSVTKLMRKYRLDGAVAMLALVAVLFLWRNASSFLPARAIQPSAPVVGRDSLEGLSALLRRGVPEKDLMNTCFAEWNKTAPRESRAVRVEQEISRAGKQGPVTVYRAARRILTEKT